MTRPIPMVDLKAQHAALGPEIDEVIAAVLESTRFVLGPNVEAFEREAAEYLGVVHAIGCASGTDALMLALAAAGVGPGDEVITTAFTFFGTAEAICLVGATPVFVDIDPRTFNLDVALVEAAVTPRTAAIIPVHLFGQPADIAGVCALCERHGLLLVEDCAQSFGAGLDGTKAGAFGDFGCFSFFPSKNLGGCGDGGMVTTRSDAMARRLRALRNHGSHVTYRHERIGYNSRLDELQAAILRVKLRHIDRYNAERRRVASRYDALLQGLPLQTPFEARAGTHVYHQYTILSDMRDALAASLRNEHIACAIHYPTPLHHQEAFADLVGVGPLPVSKSVSQQCLSLPMYPELPDHDIERIVEVIKSSACDTRPRP